MTSSPAITLSGARFGPIRGKNENVELGGLDQSLVDLSESSEERVQAWVDLANELAKLDHPLPFVGSFGAVLRGAAERTASLPDEHRRIAAAVIVNTTAAKARLSSEFRAGVEAAASIDPDVLAPATVIVRVLRPALAGLGERSGRRAVRFAADLVLEELGQVDPRVLPGDQVATLLEAMPYSPALVDAWQAFARQCPRRERKRFLSMVPSGL